MDNKFIEKIKKLLALAQSDNENEAKLAAEKAQELIVRHNIKIQSLKKENKEFIHMTLLSNQPYMKPHVDSITNILVKYFFVRVIVSDVDTGELTVDFRRKIRKDFFIIGTTENTTMAKYVFDYLSIVYQRLWLKYKKENSLGEKARKSYYLGLTHGIYKKLEETRKKVEESYGLVLVKDAELENYMDNLNLGKASSNSSCSNSTAYYDGVEDGNKININRPVEDKSEGSKTLLIGN